MWRVIDEQNFFHAPGIRPPLYSLQQHRKIRNCGSIGNNKVTHMWFPCFVLDIYDSIHNVVTYNSMVKPSRIVKNTIGNLYTRLIPTYLSKPPSQLWSHKTRKPQMCHYNSSLHRNLPPPSQHQQLHPKHRLSEILSPRGYLSSTYTNTWTVFRISTQGITQCRIDRKFSPE